MGIITLSRLIAVAVGVGFFALTPARALALCDGLDGPVVKAAQRALETRSVTCSRSRFRNGCASIFGEVMATKSFEPDDVAAGRASVKAYVEFIHVVELLYDGTMKMPNSHSEERQAPARVHGDCADHIGFLVHAEVVGGPNR